MGTNRVAGIIHRQSYLLIDECVWIITALALPPLAFHGRGEFQGHEKFMVTDWELNK
uniref:Uncharacterized protein n=1 Tax=Candidatus Kentrum sp. TUN TaxID=2126343 RepID=A0A450ZN31_9GAMM|nr:MAG: hypothetical protein BECKTUN1418F_GA0071002_102515 [Candidatus Kentron sp. TUN]VFK55138.1 MAG: hypothetical protein BECKTUN1418E_GA0071001_102515 [Candidatus Kentron sp. TUN]